MTKKFFKHILTSLLLGAPLLTLSSSPNDIYKVEEKSEIHIDFRVNTDYDVKWLNDTKMNDFENILNKELVNSTLK
ncbi:hypothetical protein [Mycoplasmopsis pullorum]|uniref:hypothetical protein n=1 Tax=Mycoplasmopsis pullorum TaxID=48003 RepID=UPI0011190431|nr:hypothetical protein [Mycoplasmopsis pullorum]TNK83721.1 hypothetical protein C4M93_01385 [Mycoplasmopsis pullorum]TNK88008.1 hypothetical protein C4M89_03925 [Mycoplasmopsis pullorum]TNK92291.1 hypothetical protein C4M96_01415 [Mycoplasmopsis pullorum]